MEANTKMNEMQLHLLKFFAQKQVSMQEAEELQRVIAHYYFEKAEKELETVMKNKNITTADIENLANKHLRTNLR
jgi:hypothetical protein